MFKRREGGEMLDERKRRGAGVAEYVHGDSKSCLDAGDGVVSALGGSITLRRLHLRLLLLLLLRRLLLLLLSTATLLRGLRRSREDVTRAVRRSVGVTTAGRRGLLRSL